ncbi:carbon-nitrogen hydrolase family protein [Marinoscillum pacificum]|uniref:carbon-nitrogen hydrolase family protein n=1 Tax=Marinoscillum pacificum TaxID=392723 RepID=UPI0021589A72|nr:carbon-nitrogen hydrolase family protein [Marinoscillum pacificum]
MSETLKVALAQMAPVWLNKQATLDKVCEKIQHAADQKAQLVVFGESLVPGYPFWVEHTEGAVFESAVQKEIYAHYVKHAVDVDAGELDHVCEVAKTGKIAVYLGIIERSKERGNSLYCSLIYIDSVGEIRSVHRKIMPTYEERLVWSVGDGNGLKVHDLPPFTVGGLNCWENWLPLARTALYAQGEDLHVSVWPGNLRNVQDLIPVIAKESRSYVIAVSGLFDETLISDDLPQAQLMKKNMKGTLANGGSCIASPDGSWLVEPIVDKEGVFCAELTIDKVREERLMLNVSGHYSRPDIFTLEVYQERQTILKKK